MIQARDGGNVYSIEFLWEEGGKGKGNGAKKKEEEGRENGGRERDGREKTEGSREDWTKRRGRGEGK